MIVSLSMVDLNKTKLNKTVCIFDSTNCVYIYFVYINKLNLVISNGNRTDTGNIGSTIAIGTVTLGRTFSAEYGSKERPLTTFDDI